MRMMRLALSLVCAVSIGASPATKPAKPPTYADLQKEVDRLRAENDQLRQAIARTAEAKAQPILPAGETEAEKWAREMTIASLEERIANIGKLPVAPDMRPKFKREMEDSLREIKAGKRVKVPAIDEQHFHNDGPQVGDYAAINKVRIAEVIKTKEAVCDVSCYVQPGEYGFLQTTTVAMLFRGFDFSNAADDRQLSLGGAIGKITKTERLNGRTMMVIERQ